MSFLNVRFCDTPNQALKIQEVILKMKIRFVRPVIVGKGQLLQS